MRLCSGSRTRCALNMFSVLFASPCQQETVGRFVVYAICEWSSPTTAAVSRKRFQRRHDRQDSTSHPHLCNGQGVAYPYCIPPETGLTDSNDSVISVPPESLSQQNATQFFAPHLAGFREQRCPQAKGSQKVPWTRATFAKQRLRSGQRGRCVAPDPHSPSALAG